MLLSRRSVVEPELSLEFAGAATGSGAVYSWTYLIHQTTIFPTTSLSIKPRSKDNQISCLIRYLGCIF